MPEPDFTLTEDELRRLDASYRPFPSFADWASQTQVNEAEWRRFRDLLAERRGAVTEDEHLAAREVVMRAAAFDTGAIEGLYATDRGFTFSVAQRAAEWERGLAARGPLAPALFDAQLRAYELVLDAVTQRRPVTEAGIRRLHEELCLPQETYVVYTPVGPQAHRLEVGSYKHLPNHVLQPDGTRHAYCPVGRVGDEMHRLVETLRSDAFAAAHPVLQASYAHYAFVVVHPFADGNGRVARALASTYFYRDLSLPLVVLNEQREEYLDVLSRADAGEWQGFVDFTADRGIEAVQFALDLLASGSAPSLDAAMQELEATISEPSPASPADWQDLAGTLLDAAVHALGDAGQRLPPAVKLGVLQTVTALPAGPRHHRLGTEPNSLMLRLEHPPNGVVVRAFVLGAPTLPDSPFVCALVDAVTDAAFDLRLMELWPDVSPALRLRLRHWAENVLAGMANELGRNSP